MTDFEFENLCNKVFECALFAKENQKKINRSYKEDGTVLTESDLKVSEILVSYLIENFPDYNVITEESDTMAFKTDAPYTFVLDPIDGTDCYSQGLPNWCIALGIMDSNLVPVGGIICAPRFGVGSESMLLTTKPNSLEVFLNGQKISVPKHREVPHQYVMGSNTLHLLDFPVDFDKKVRSFGSSIIHMVCPAVFTNLDVCLDPPCFVWDICASFAIVKKMGLCCKNLDGSDFEFSLDFVTNREKFKQVMVIGQEDSCSYVCKNFKAKNSV